MCLGKEGWLVEVQGVIAAMWEEDVGNGFEEFLQFMPLVRYIHVEG